MLHSSKFKMPFFNFSVTYSSCSWPRLLMIFLWENTFKLKKLSFSYIKKIKVNAELNITSLHYVSYIVSYIYLNIKLAQDLHSSLSNIPNNSKLWSFGVMKSECETEYSIPNCPDIIISISYDNIHTTIAMEGKLNQY